jgi:hypothetical protein
MRASLAMMADMGQVSFEGKGLVHCHRKYTVNMEAVIATAKIAANSDHRPSFNLSMQKRFSCSRAKA